MTTSYQLRTSVVSKQSALRIFLSRAAALFLLLSLTGVVNGQTVITVGASGANYTTIETAYGTGIPATITGAYIIELQSDYNPSDESFPITLAAKTGASASNTITIRPAAGVSSAFNITANVTTQTFTLSGADFVIIDGRPGGTGSNKYITIENSSTNNSASTNTVQFINDACNNVIRYCTVKGSVTNGAAGSGAISFSTGTTTGNDDNTIQYCDLTAGGGGRPYAMIGANGTSAKENSGNIIEYNNFYDHFVVGATSNGIAIGQYNIGFVIRNNNFYETTTFQPSGGYTYTHISLGGTTNSYGHEVLNNYFGGKQAECGGSAMEIDGGTIPVGAVYRAITVNAGTTTPCSIQNNIIRNINLKSNSASCFGGIYVTGGSTNIGTVTGNVIGSGTGNGSVYITSYYASSNTVYGIYLSGSGTLDVRNNTVGSITAANNDPVNETVSIIGIYSSATGTTTINTNTIGSTATANSIWASSYPTGTDAQRVYGIWGAGPGATGTISGNTIANLRNDYGGTANSCGTYGIGVQSTGNYTITDNKICYLYNANGNTTTTETRGLIGILNIATGNTGTDGQHITGNTINNLYCTHATAAVQPVGIYVKSQFVDTRDYSSNYAGNFIHSIFVASTSTSAAIMGMHLDNSGTFTYNIDRNIFNNIITLGTGENDNCLVYGIYESNTGNRRSNIYFNTVYIGGSPNGNTNTFALNIAGSSASNTRDIKNNIFINARSRTGGTGKHYAAYFGYSSGLTVNYNNYYTPGTGGTLGYYPSADKTSLPIVTGQDANSLALDPQFVNAGGIYPADFRLQNSSLDVKGVAISGYGTDYGGFTRPAAPTMGAIEFSNPLPVELTSFTARVSGNRVTLLWETATEIDNYGFEIERKKLPVNGDFSSGSEWQKIGFVPGHTISNSPKYYLFEDIDPAPARYNYRLKQIDNDGSFTYSGEVLADLNSVPVEYSLGQNYPNPFNPSTVIPWAIPIDGHVFVSIYNLLGEEVAVLFNGEAKAGTYSSSFNASSLSSGVYIYRLTAGSHSSAKRMMLQK